MPLEQKYAVSERQLAEGTKIGSQTKNPLNFLERAEIKLIGVRDYPVATFHLDSAR